MKSKLFAATLITGSLLVPVSAFADVNVDNVQSKTVTKTHELPNGNTLEVGKKGQWDGEGNARGKRAFRVTDESGDVVRRGLDRGRKTDDGKVARTKKREFTDAQGNTYQKRARFQRDGQGNARAQRHGQKRNADGQVVARGKDRARKHSDGSYSRATNKRWVNANGNRQTKKRIRKSKG